MIEGPDLTGKVVLITGALGGIGKATALRFARHGGLIAAWDLPAAAPGTFMSEIEAAGGGAFYQAVNVVDAAAIEAAVATLLERWGKIDVLINNAGILRDSQLVKRLPDGRLLQMPEELWDAVIDINLKGVFLTTRAVAPQMIRQGAGVILNASSVVGIHGNFGQTNYVASKAGVIGLTQTWARELGKYNIRVNAVAPGFIATEMIKSMPDAAIQNMLQHTPLKRMGQPEDVANAYFWLASEQASFVHGTVLSVDGGVVVGT